ncbi:MAG: hypothetical protein R3F19_03470 [Verrucomicrobiales bacterium]
MRKTLQVVMAGILPWMILLSPAVAGKGELFSRPVLIGASVSAGFTESELFGGEKTAGYQLKHYFDAAILSEHAPTETFGGAFFFMSPEKTGATCIEKALAAKPSLVVAIDFLFWFCYGEGMTPEQRLTKFEEGLKLLEKIDAPMVVGDIPYASAAVDKMLSKEQLPPKEIVEQCNKRIREWGGNREAVAVVSLSDFMEAAVANQALNVREHIWAEGSTRALLQGDLLHPSHHGCVGLTAFVLDAALTCSPAVQSDCVCWDLQKIYTEGLASARAAFASKAAPKNEPAAKPE